MTAQVIPCLICGKPVADGSNYFVGNEKDGHRTHAACLYRQEGYELATADIVALLKTGRTAGGEVILSPVHAAIVIERGDAKGFARKAAGNG